MIETLENLCDRFLTYDVHKERTGIDRFSRGMSVLYFVDIREIVVIISGVVEFVKTLEESFIILMIALPISIKT